MNKVEMRELDAEIHRKIFVFTDLQLLPVFTSPDCGQREVAEYGYPGTEPDWCYLPKYEHDGESDLLCRVVPAYSSDIAEAWQVMEWFRSQGRLPRLITYENDKWSWRVDLVNPVQFVVGETAPLAICRAAVKSIL